MKVRRQQETKVRKGRGKSRKQSTSNRSRMDSDSDVVLVETNSDPRPDVKETYTISLLDTTTDSIISINELTNSADEAANTWDKQGTDAIVDTNGVVERSKIQPKMKDFTLVIKRAENVPGLLTKKNRDELSKMRRRAKERQARQKRPRVKRPIKKRSNKPSKALTIASFASSSELFFNQATPTKSDKRSHKFKSNIKEIKKEICNNDQSMISPRRMEAEDPPSFGKKCSPDLEAWWNKNKAEDLKQELVSNYTPSNGSNISSTTRKRSRRDDEMKDHRFDADLKESGRKQREKKAAKHPRKDNNQRIEKLCKQLENQTIVNGKFSLSNESTVSRADDSKVSENSVAQSTILTDTVENPFGEKSIDYGKENNESGKRNIVFRKENTVSNTESNVSDKENIVSGDATVVVLRSVAEKLSAVNNVENRCNDICPSVNGDLGTEELGLDSYLDCDVDTKFELETNGNGPSTLFSASDNEPDPALGKEPITWDSITQAIAIDEARGNRLSPIPFSLLTVPSMPEDIEHRLDVSSKSHESFHAPPANGLLAGVLSNGNGSHQSCNDESLEINGNESLKNNNNESFKSNSNGSLQNNGNGNLENNGTENMKRKLPAIMLDEILPMGSINLQIIRENLKKRKTLNKSIVTPVSSVENNRNLNDVLKINDSCDDEMAVQPFSEKELDENTLLLGENSANNNSFTSVKDRYTCEDALNNNRETTVTNKNEINSEKRPGTITLYAASSQISDVDVNSSIKDHLDYMTCFLEQESNALIQESMDSEVQLETEIFDVHEIDKALEQCRGDSNLSNTESLKDMENGKANPSVAILTKQNLDKFNSSLVGDIEVQKTASLIRRETIDTDAFSHRTDVSVTESAKIRRRKWIPTDEKPTSLQASCNKIKLNRRKWSSGSRDSRSKSVVSDKSERKIERSIDRSVDAETTLVTTRLPTIDDKKNGVENGLENPLITATVSTINEITRQLIPPIKTVQGCGSAIGQFDPDFGASSLYKIATSTPSKIGVRRPIAGDSGESSSSDSSSGSASSSSSSSSDEESSDESEAEDVANHIQINEEHDFVTTKKGEGSCQSNSVIESPTQTTQTVAAEMIVASFGAGAEKGEMEKSAGSLIDDNNDPEGIEDDKSDCISLDTESLSMSRCASPERSEVTKHNVPCNSPTKQPKLSNVRSRLGPRVNIQTQPNTSTAFTTDLRANMRNSRVATNDSRIVANSARVATNDSRIASNYIGTEISASNVVNIQHLANNVVNVQHPDNNVVNVQHPDNNVVNIHHPDNNIVNIHHPDNNIVNIQHRVNNVVNIQHRVNDVVNMPATNNVLNNRPAPGQVIGLIGPNVYQIVAEAAPPVELTGRVPNVSTPREMETFFRGHCFLWLRTGVCRIQNCQFDHFVRPGLKFQLRTVANHRAIIHYAVGKTYRYFIAIVQRQLMSVMTVPQIIAFCLALCTSRCIAPLNFLNVIEALKERDFSLAQIVNLFDTMLPPNDMETSMLIIEALSKLLEPGSRWETLKKIMSKFPVERLPIAVVIEVLDECVKLHKDKLHLDDVYENLVCKLPIEAVVSIPCDLWTTFYELLNSTNVVMESNDLIVETAQKSNWTCSIASPDSPRHSIDFSLAPQLEDCPTTSSPTPLVQPQSIRANSQPPTSIDTRGVIEEYDNQVASTSGGSNSYIVKPLGKLPPPKSAYSNVMWRFHLDLVAVREGLKHGDYDLVIKTLTENQLKPDRLPHMAGFYSILCKEIMLSRHHLDEIVRRTVQSGASDELRRFVYDIGVYVLTTLADTETWVLAYELLKTFKVYGQYNTCAFTLLSAEIYIANHRPLKALAVLKQSGLIFTNTRNWNQMWCPNDEPLRVSVMELLLKSLCDGHAEHALSLLDFILGDQCSSVKPINISRHLDRLALVLLAENRTSTVVDLGRLIFQNNLTVSSKIFRALINHIFHSDQFLAKQLHRYATWLGTYTMPKISGITHMIVNIDWTEEEMYLMFSMLIYELYLNIGHAIGRLRPRQLGVYLILETMPTEQQLLRDASEPPLTNAEIKKRRAVVKNVFERFDPKIKIIQKAQGKFCKIQSESLVNYLKAGHFEC